MKLHISILTPAVLAGALALPGAPAWAQATTASAGRQDTAAVQTRPIVYAGLFVVRTDSRTGGHAAQTGDALGDDMSGTLYIAPCGVMGAGSPGRPVSAFATDVWQLSGKVIELTEEYATVQLGWRRTRRSGQDEQSPEQSQALTLKRGDRTTLDQIVVPAAGSCEARSLSFDVAFGSRQEISGAGVISTSRGGGVGGGSTGTVVRSAQGSTFGAAAGAAAGSTNYVSAGGGSSTSGLGRLKADLWLVRSSPGRNDETLHITSQLGPMPATYTFVPLTIQGASGPVTVNVQGTLEAGQAPDGERRFHFTASRTVSSLTTNRPARDVAPLVEGSTKTTVAMPGAEEVLSFEMPPLRTADGTTLPDRLSIRVRITGSPVQ